MSVAFPATLDRTCEALTGWTAFSADTDLSVASTNPAFGSGCLRCEAKNNGQYQGPITSQKVTVSPSTQYTASVFVRSPNAHGFSLQIQEQTAGGGFVANQNLNLGFLPGDDVWRRYTLTFTTNASTERLQNWRVYNNAAQSTVWFIDAWQLDTGSTAQTYDGSDSSAPPIEAAASLAGTGSLVAAAQRRRRGQTSLAGTGGLTASAGAVRSGAVSLAGVGSLSADADVIAGVNVVTAEVSLAGAGTLAASASVVFSAAVTLQGVGSLTVAYRPEVDVSGGRPSLDKTVEITDPSGNSYRWGAGARDPRDVPLSIRYSTRQGKGFDSCSLSLSRRLDVEYPDLALEHELRIIGAQGQVLWEGFTSGTPRERTIDGGDSLTVQAQGFMDDAAREPFVELIIDRELSQWGEAPRWRQQSLHTGGFVPLVPASAVDGRVKLQINHVEQAGSIGVVCESHYVAPTDIGEVAVTLSDNINLNSNWTFVLRAASLGGSTGGEDSITMDAPRVLSVVAPGGNRRAYMFLRRTTPFTGDGQWSVNAMPVVYGATALPRRARPDGGLDGIYVSDILRYLWGKYYPQADLSGVQQTTYPVPHAVWRDPTDLITATAELNKYHGWQWGMWEGKKLEFGPVDFQKTADWQVRAGQDGVEIQAAGDSTEAIHNGATVSWTDFSGQAHFLSARNVPELRDDSPWIPANQWGKQTYYPVNISWPCEQTDAIEIARLVLAAANRAKRPSVITVPYYIRNGAGDWRPVGEVRSGETIAVTNLVGDAPRLITATDIDGDRLVISTDDAIADLETYLYRLDSQTQIGAPR